MLRVKVVTEIIVVALKLLGLAKRLHPKLFATFQVVLFEAIDGQPNTACTRLVATSRGTAVEYPASDTTADNRVSKSATSK